MNTEQFADKVEALRPRLYRTALCFLGNEQDALEALDEAVYRALRALKKLRQPEYFDTWMTRILINECNRELKRRNRFLFAIERKAVAQENLDELPLQEAIQALPEELKQVVILRFFSGYTQAETAATLGIPQGTVATRQRKALAMLKLDLKEGAE